MKIAMISSPFIECPPRTYGGLERVVYDLCCGLTELGQKVVLFAPKGSQVPPKGFLYETVEPVLKYGTDWGKVDWFEKEKEAYEVFKEPILNGDFDIVCGHNWFGHEYLLKRINPSLHTAHVHHGGLNWRTKPCEKMNLIAISRFMAEVYARQLNTHVHFVYNGIDLDAYPFKKEKGDRLIYVGRFTSFKGTHIAIEVAKRLGMRLDLVGGAYEEPYFSQQVKPHCDGKQIVLHTEVPHEEKVRLLQDARALLFPSRMGEPFGLVYTEAAACGTPTVALRDGAIPEIVVEGVSGFVRDDVEGMVEAMRRIDEIRPEACRAVVEQNFTKEIMSKRYLKLYNQILRGEEW
jgi:glycosyltransferase involved in cell wall biosynthesis